MGADDGIEIGLTQRDIEMGKVKPKEKEVKPGIEKNLPHPNPLVQKAIDEADQNLGEEDPDWEEHRKEIPSLVAVDEDYGDQGLEKADAEIFPFLADIKKGPVMHEADFKLRNRATAEAIDKFRETPESIGFEDLAGILKAEEDDLEVKNSEPEVALSPFQSEWIRLELHYVRTAAEALGIMRIGGKIKDDDPRAMALDEYLRSKLTQLENARDAISDPDLHDLAESSIGVFEVFYDKTFNYEPPKKPKKKTQN